MPFQATSHDLSLGGGAFLSSGRSDVTLPGHVHIEFTLSGQRLILPATIGRWERRSLQVSWQVETIADESRVVQAVFGRADAWVDWNRYPADRPMASLWSVLVSIRGLFRRRGRLIGADDLGPQPATAPGRGRARHPGPPKSRPPASVALGRGGTRCSSAR